MIVPAPLQGITALITRPAEQSKHLCHLIALEGGKTVQFPTLEIQATHNNKLHWVAEKLSQFDLALFISRASVAHSITIIKQYWPILPPKLMIGAIGPGTAATLKQYNVSVDFYPQDQASSESLLALPELHRLQSRRIVLFRGKGGRKLLATCLRKRKATLIEVTCYQRALPKIKPEAGEALLQNQQISVVIATSVAGLQNLFTLLGKKGEKWLQNLSWIVISDRIQKAALVHGIKLTPYVTDNPSDEAILTTLARHSLGPK